MRDDVMMGSRQASVLKGAWADEEYNLQVTCSVWMWAGETFQGYGWYSWQDVARRSI